MAERLLLDTDVLVDYLRDHPDAVAYIRELEERPLVSAITVAELYAGVREGKERRRLETFGNSFVVIRIDGRIAAKGGLYRRDYGKSHNVGLADALIAATADLNKARLVTLNKKHFPMLKGVIVPYKKT